MRDKTEAAMSLDRAAEAAMRKDMKYIVFSLFF